jgi:hypothetical protein
LTNASCTPRECLQIEDSAENRSRTNDRASLEYKTSSSRRETLISFTSPSLDSHQSLNTPEVAAQAAMWDSEKSSLVCPAQTSELLPLPHPLGL